MNHIKESAKMRHQRQGVRLFCKIPCQKFNHNADDYFKNPVNNVTRLQEAEDDGNNYVDAIGQLEEEDNNSGDVEGNEGSA